MSIKDAFSNYSDRLNDWRDTASKAADYAGIQSEGMKYAKDLVRGSLQQSMAPEDGAYGRTAEMKAQPLVKEAPGALNGNEGYDFVNAKRQAAKDIAEKKVAEEAEKAKTTQSFIGNMVETAGSGLKAIAMMKGQQAGLNASAMNQGAADEGYKDFNAMIDDKYGGDLKVANTAAAGRGFKSYQAATDRAHQHGYATAEDMFRAFDRFGITAR